MEKLMERNERVAQGEARVRVRLPLAQDMGDGMRADQSEQVIVNGRVWNIRRGESVEVPTEVFLLLRERYPDI